MYAKYTYQSFTFHFNNVCSIILNMYIKYTCQSFTFHFSNVFSTILNIKDHSFSLLIALAFLTYTFVNSTGYVKFS